MAEVKSRQAEGVWFESYLVPFLSCCLLLFFVLVLLFFLDIHFFFSYQLLSLSLYFWLFTSASRGSAIHVFLVSVYFCHPSTVIFQILISFNKIFALHIIF